MLAMLIDLFDTSGFPPRWHCGLWPAWLGWLHVLSDLGTFTAYTAIPLVLGYFVLRKREAVPFPTIFWLFAAFIFSCGTVLLVEAIIFWKPIYPFSGFVKLLTALVSWATVIALVHVMPEALRLPGLAKLNDQLRERETELAMLFVREQHARADAERSNRLKEDFLSTVSHELRTPLNAMLGYTQLLLGESLPNEQRRQVETIERNARAQARLIDDLLDMSRIDAGKTQVRMQPLDLCRVVCKVVEAMRPDAREKGVQLIERLPDEAAPTWGDDVRLQQITWNLLNNALKFTPAGGTVELSLTTEEDRLVLRVKDDGRGIDPAFLPQVFDRFRQGEPSLTRRHEGLGIGLSIVKKLTELHGGDVSVTSPGLARGATFTVRLPLRDQADPPALSPASDPDAALKSDARARLSLKDLDVLIVEDDADASQLLRLLLERAGARVRTAASAAEALESLAERVPGLVLSDVGMPGTDGYELIRRFRSLPKGEGGDVPAIAVTALARAEDRVQALRAGFQAHVGKPLDTEELFAVIAAVVGPGGRRV